MVFEHLHLNTVTESSVRSGIKLLFVSHELQSLSAAP